MKKKVTKIEKTKEEILNDDLQRLVRNIHNLPIPLIKYEVGEKVRIGNLLNCVVKNVSHEGRYYHVQYQTKGNWQNGTSGNILDHESWWEWRSLEKINDNDKIYADQEFSKYRIQFFQQNIDGLLSKIYSFGVDFESEYQRDYVWNEKDKEELLESIFNGIDIGKFIFLYLPYKSPTSLGYEIVDGKQRLSTLKDFFENKIKFKGLYFHELSRYDRMHFENYPISLAELREGTSKKQILKLFIRINTFGKVMDKKHIEKVQEMLDACKDD